MLQGMIPAIPESRFFQTSLYISCFSRSLFSKKLRFFNLHYPLSIVARQIIPG